MDVKRLIAREIIPIVVYVLNPYIVMNVNTPGVWHTFDECPVGHSASIPATDSDYIRNDHIHLPVIEKILKSLLLDCSPFL